MMKAMVCILALQLLAAQAALDGFECKDLHAECPQWRMNMAQAQSMTDGPEACKGQDYGYMLNNCPKTCELCDEAEKAEEEKRKNPTYEPSDSHVIQLNSDTIDDFLASEPLVLLEFYAPWCGHCQHVAPEFRTAAKLVAKEDLPIQPKFAKFNDAAHRDYGAGSEAKFNFSSYPSMFVVRNGKHKWSWADSSNGEAMAYHMTQLAHGKTQKEAAIAWNKVEMGQKPGMYKEGGRHETPHVLDLNHENYRDVVLRSDKLWVVEYYSDKCPVCDSLAPELIKAAEKGLEDFGDKVGFAAVNSRVYKDLAKSFEIKSYPWVASFYLGKKDEDMAGMGGWESFYNFAKRKSENIWNGSPANAEAEIPEPPKDEEEESGDDGEVHDDDEEEAAKTYRCDVDKPTETECTEREQKYLTKYKTKTADELAAAAQRVQKMKTGKVAPHLLEWMEQRLEILEQLSAKAKAAHTEL